MSVIMEIGNVCETLGEMHVEWQIPDFFHSSNTNFKSPVFCLTDSSWSLIMNPNGGEQYSDSEVFLERKDSGSPKTVKMSLGIKTANGGVEDWGIVSYKLPDENSRGTSISAFRFVSKSYLMERNTQLVPSDVLTVACTLASVHPYPAEVSLSNSLWNLSQNLNTMLKEKRGTDFTLKVQGCDFPVHRMILEGRCGFFKGMLSNRFRENETGVAEIDDIEKDVFQCILVYLYTGKMEGISNEKVYKIYVAADKLLLGELKKFCVNYMKENLSHESICDALAIVEKYEESGLKKLALDYFTQHADQIFESDEWNTFKDENEDLVPNFLQNIIVKLMKLVKASQ